VCSSREVEELQAIEEGASKKEFEEEDHTFVTPNVRELLTIRRAHHIEEVLIEPC